ncbi:importin-4 isoform X2 [Drosophila bipectinata]|nr:importin-4 [Drosophila bipectinata]
METALVEIICGLLCSDNDKIRQSTAALSKAYENPEAILGFCNIVVSPMETQIRQFAAVLLNKRLGKLRHWQALNADQQNTMKQIALQALIAEKEKGVKNAIAQLIGSIVRHEAEKKDSWLSELLKFIFDRCVSADPKESEMGSSTFATLTDSAPDQFVPHMDTICMIFANVLVSAENNGDLTTPTVCNMLAGITYLMPFIAGHSAAEHTVAKVLPQILKSLHAFAYKGVAQEFQAAFDILDCMIEYSPKLLTNIKPILDFSMEISANTQLDDSIRVQVISFLGRLVKQKKKVVTKQKLLEPVLSVVFNVMCCSPTGDDDEDYFSNDGGDNPITAASQALDIMALSLSPEKLIPPLLHILETALQSPDPIRRRAAFLAMAVIAEGCSDSITSKYLEAMLNIIKGGIADQSPFVRNSAFFCLGQFAEHMQPEISKYSPQILPVLFEYLGQLVNDLKNGLPQSKYTDRMFYALEAFVENLEDKIKPDLPILMERLFPAMDAQNPPRIRELALSAVGATATAAKVDFMPYFPRTIAVLQNYMLLQIPEGLEQVRIEAMDALAALARVVGKENFLPLANDSMGFCLSILENGTEDPELRRAAYNLMAALSIVAKEDMAAVFPKIMDRIVESVISSEDVLPRIGSADDVDPNIEINLEDESDGEDDDSELEGFQVENDYLMEKEEAILALKEFAANTGAAFAPYLQSAFENVYKIVDHPSDGIRHAAVEALTQFVKALHKIGDTDGVSRACLIVVPKFAQILRNDEESSVVIVVLEALGDLFKEVKKPAVPTAEIAEIICLCIKDLLTNKMACQFSESGCAGGGDEEDDDESEIDDAIIENSANLLPLFGHALESKDFSAYFGRLYSFFVQRMSKKNSDTSMRSFLFGTLADCFQSLGIWSVSYFDTMCPIFLKGASDSDPRTRQNSFYGLGELVLHAQQKSFDSYPTILQALSDAIAKEKDPPALDNICGAVARLIITNTDAVPLAHVLPVFMSNLPLREDVEENDTLQKAFRVLYIKARPAIEPYLEQMLAITIQMLYKKQLPDSEATENVIGFIKEIGQSYPEQFSRVSNSTSEVFQFVQSL